MSHFVPEEEDLFPCEEIIDKVIAEGIEENILEVAKEHVPTNFELLEQFIKDNPNG
jgi:hypothetical protein